MGGVPQFERRMKARMAGVATWPGREMAVLEPVVGVDGRKGVRLG